MAKQILNEVLRQEATKLYAKLAKQLRSEEYKKDAEDCIEIFEKLKDIDKDLL